MARLAVNAGLQRTGYGALLVGHAVNCSLALRGKLGVRVLLVDALGEQAAAFYRQYGFRETTARALTLYLPLGAWR
jgi:GNAT superfamily N-acetyltransferase